MKSNKQQNQDDDWEDADDMGEEEEKEETLETPGVIDKYQAAGKIANSVLQRVIAKCVPGASIAEVCAYGDSEIETELSKVYTKKNKCEKGIGFPTTISINNIAGHYSPLASEDSNLSEGNLAKIDLGVHIDGYIAVVAHTIMVNSDPATVTDGRAADVILAAYNSIQAALRLLKPGNKNHEVTSVVQKVSDSYNCNPLEGVISHDLKKHLIDGNACIINKETFDQHVEEHEFGVNEVFGLECMVSSGEGKTKECEIRTTVFKRNIERTFILKTKSARVFYNEVIKKYPTFCFSSRSFEDEITAKLGVKECVEHDLLNPYPVLAEKNGEVIAQFKYTVMILQGGTVAITGLPLDQSKFKSEHKLEDEYVNSLLQMSMDKDSQKKQKKKNKKKQQAEATA